MADEVVVTTPQPASGAARPGKVNHRSRGKNAGPQPYDFRRPTKLSREHIRTLQLAYETFARRYTTVLTSSLRVVSQVTLISIEQASYDEYVTGLSNPTLMAQVSVEPLPGIAVLEFSTATAMAAVDHMLGGPGGPQPQRPLSEIETSLVRGLITRILEELRNSLDPITTVRPALGAIEYNPQFLQVAAGSDAMIVALFEMKVGDEECVATFCLPLGAIFPKLNEDTTVTLTASQRTSRDLARRNLTTALENVPIDVSVRFDAQPMHPEEIVGLKPGDVVRLRHPVASPLAITAAGMTFAHAVPGNQGSRLACLVVPAPPVKEDAR